VEFAALERISKIPEEKRAEIFKRFDKNGDGQIQRSEMKPPERPDGDKRFFPRIHELDSNKDGKVTFEEFEKGEFAGRMPKDRLGEFFGKLDRNGDGELSPADMSQDRRPPYDRPRDGGPPNRDGRFQNHESGKMIEALDKDGDKALSFDEFRQAPWLKDKSEDEQEDLFEKIDKNGDLSIVKSELPVEGPKGPERKRPAGPNGPGPRAPKGPDGGQ
jgi:Ca2+-binding EF-hand superfamily protein